MKRPLSKPRTLADNTGNLIRNEFDVVVNAPDPLEIRPRDQSLFELVASVQRAIAAQAKASMMLVNNTASPRDVAAFIIDEAQALNIALKAATPPAKEGGQL